MKIRLYRKSDYRKVFKLIDTVIREIFDLKLINAYDLKDVKANYFKKGGAFYVLEHDKQIIGTIGVFVNSDSVAKIKRMYIDKKHRKSGLGQKLLDKVFEFCKNKNYNKITLTTYPQMKAAIRFYKKNGFRKISLAKDGGIVMIKKLLY